MIRKSSKLFSKDTPSAMSTQNQYKRNSLLQGSVLVQALTMLTQNTKAVAMSSTMVQPERSSCSFGLEHSVLVSQSFYNRPVIGQGS